MGCSPARKASSWESAARKSWSEDAVKGGRIQEKERRLFELIQSRENCDADVKNQYPAIALEAFPEVKRRAAE